MEKECEKGNKSKFVRIERENRLLKDVIRDLMDYLDYLEETNDELIKQVLSYKFQDN